MPRLAFRGFKWVALHFELEQAAGAKMPADLPDAVLNDGLAGFGDTPVGYNRCWMNSSVTPPPEAIGLQRASWAFSC
jgi:hypothetical protein